MPIWERESVGQSVLCHIGKSMPLTVNKANTDEYRHLETVPYGGYGGIVHSRGYPPRYSQKIKSLVDNGVNEELQLYGL